MRIYHTTVKTKTNREIDHGTPTINATREGILLILDHYSVKLNMLEISEIVEKRREYITDIGRKLL